MASKINKKGAKINALLDNMESLEPKVSRESDGFMKAEDKTKLDLLPDNEGLQEQFDTKQDVIDDLATIRSGAAAGSTAYQKPGTGIPEADMSDAVKGKLAKAESALQEHQDISGKQDVINDLATIRSGAAAGSTAYQKPAGGIPEADMSDAVKGKLAKAESALQEHQDISGKQDVINDLAAIRSGAAAGATAYQKPASGIPSSDLSAEVQDMIENGGKTKSVSVNGGTPVTPDANGQVDLTIEQANVTIGNVTTGEEGTNAEVTNSGTPTAPVLNFKIPRGATGGTGPKGATGDSAVYDPSSPDTPDFVMANETGQSTTKAMTQKAVTDAIDAVPEELGLAGYETQNWDGFIDRAYVRDYGSYATMFAQNGNNKIYYYRVLAGEKWLVRCEGATASGSAYADYAIIPSVPVTGSTRYTNYAPNSGNSNIPVVITADGYLCISRGSAAPVICKKWVAKKATEEAQGQIRDNLYAWQTIERTGAVSGHYVNNYGRWAANVQTYYWAVRKGETWRVTGPNTTSYAAWAFFRDVPTTDSNPNQYKPWTTAETGVFTATEDGYLATAGTVEGLSASKLVAPDLQPLQDYLGNKTFFKKKCIYIGDSISTNNNYYWKGYMKTMHALDYVTSEAGELAPAAGGITLIPPTEEPSSVNTKSIWYRCAAQRMSAFSFDLISLFGGTNDLTDQSLNLGTVDDTPYVDDATGMTGVTDVRPETLTYAAALKGCIEMLRRDFPTTPIVLCTVLACSSTYGGWIYGDTGLTASEAMAELQVKIAELYNLRHVPFYWTVRTREQASRHVYALDGVHPNQMCAQRMRKEFAAALNL